MNFKLGLVFLFSVGINAFGSHSRTISDSSVSINGPLYVVTNDKVEKVYFPNLEFVNGPIYVVNNEKLNSISFPKLKYVNGPIYISYNYLLESAQFSEKLYVNGPFYYYMNGIKP